MADPALVERAPTAGRRTSAAQLGLDLFAGSGAVEANKPRAEFGAVHPLDGKPTARAMFDAYLARRGAQAFACSEGRCSHA
ncbi:MAG TPA: hypothetical protein VGV85_08585 [Longimicrobiaceae bacterium]|nr:hypothetical protein [Longimicrobiaceae bacterium]